MNTTFFSTLNILHEYMTTPNPSLEKTKWAKESYHQSPHFFPSLNIQKQKHRQCMQSRRPFACKMCWIIKNQFLDKYILYVEGVKHNSLTRRYRTRLFSCWFPARETRMITQQALHCRSERLYIKLNMSE